MPPQPHDFWQAFVPPGTYETDPEAGHEHGYPATLADGRQLLLPIRVLPGDGRHAVASLIINQASFDVEDGLAKALADVLMPYAPEVIIGVPTLGLLLASNVARRLAHTRMVPLGTSRKFWYQENLSEPMSSITSPGHAKTLFLDPRMLPLVKDKRVAIVDDVVSSGKSMLAALRLLERAGITPAVIGCAMLQGSDWRDALALWQDRIVAPLASPLLVRKPNGRWQAVQPD